MNGRTCRSSNVRKDKSSANKKRKSITENNIRQNTRGWKTTNDSVTNIGMIGKTTGKDDYNMDNDINRDESDSDLSEESDDDEDKVKNMSTKKRRSQYENVDFLVKSMLEMNDRMKRFEDSLK